ncbi:helix-turn-helix transcriptional regulator [Chryseobacterium sp. CFS15]|uniref:helix-turn-helix domain-containing protein n=1 Tax=Chryseobacterium sp. CFS15 TaxID=2986946 RepID=UPI0028075597|nr:helix-turn-helix transcriptional regulator [Chryseobacterium sp. CFS15]MDQ8141107.1 helix-turn-helix transcriptional regulator [Chryseobacterium sp. CFS15]
MSEKSKSIPLNTFPSNFGSGIIISKFRVTDLEFDKIKEAHRDDYHIFFLLEEGSGVFEIDFRRFEINSQSITYVQPYQVHRGLSLEEGLFTVLLISTESLHPEYLKLLKEITPANPLQLDTATFSIASKMGDLTSMIFCRQEEKLHNIILRDSCNSLVGFIISQFLLQSYTTDKPSRSETISKNFKLLVDQNFVHTKSPAEYAEKMNISTVYLNECVKRATGQTVSYHIHQRIVLEAKRLLFHSNKSVKEIAAELGYDDYAYFSRLFMKVTGMTALTFRNKNLE